MYYPKNVYSVNETVTRAAMREHDKKAETWYRTAETMYPDYFRLPLRERVKLRNAISKAVGYDLF